MTTYCSKFVGISVLAAALLPFSVQAGQTASSRVSPEKLQEQLEQQQQRIAELERLLAQQGQLLEGLRQQLAPQQNPERAPRVPAAQEKVSETARAAPQTERGTSETGPSASSQNQTQALETRLKKVEEQVLKLGPIRFSGDMRLRLDAILRRATEPPDPPLPHVQNIRGRYRLRLNMDDDINPALSFHGQLSTAPINNGVTLDQDFTSGVARHPLFISEAWIDYHPNKSVQLQGGRVQEVFADNSRFLFDDDVRFNGFNQRVSFGKGGTSVELRGGQYLFSNPNVAIVRPDSPLAHAGDQIGTIGRSAALFHQGIILNNQFNKKWSQQIGGDVQLFREPNQIQLASTADGVAFLVQPGLGLALSGPMTGTGNATTTQGGAIYTAENFHVVRLTHRLTYSGFNWADHPYPVSFNVQVARNLGTDQRERDAMLAALQIGRPAKRGDMSFLYVFSIKGANSMISQLTDDDLGTLTGVNIRAHYFRWDLGLARKVTLQSLAFVQRELRSSGQFPNFFVPLGAFAPRQYRFQQQVLFSF